MKNRKTICIWQTWIILGISIMTVDSVAQCPNEQEIQKYESKTEFFRNSGTGVMAIMPHVKSQREARNEHTYVAFSNSGTYKLDQEYSEKNDFWFATNHRIVDRNNSDQSSHTYLGVMIAKVLRRNLESQLELVRNNEWYDLQSGASLSEFHRLFKSAQAFTSIQRSKEGDIQLFKKSFNNWHALANKDPRLSSWDLRREWSEYNLACLKEISKNNDLNLSQILVQARLMKFQPTETDNPLRPVVWKVQLGEAEAVYIKTFSPVSADFVREYYIGFAR